MNDKKVCFAGHRYDWLNIGIEDKLRNTIEKLINKGYSIFYDGGQGVFDNMCAKIVINLKRQYPQIKIYKVFTYYNCDKEKINLSADYDGSIMPNIEQYHPKLRIIKKNEWLVNNSDILVCHICETYRSGAYRTLKYAQKLNKPVIYL